MIFSRILFAITATALLAPHGVAQSGAQQLLQGAVEKIDAKYKDVDDAVVMFARNNPTAAMSLLAKAKKEHPEVPPAEIMYAQLCFMNNKVEAARAILEIAAVKIEDDPEPWLLLGELAGRSGQVAASQVLFQEALEKTANLKGNEVRQHSLQVKAYSGLARIHERRGQWEKAEGHLLHWMELDAENTSAMGRLAAAYFRQEKFDDAQSVLEDLRELDKTQPLPEVVMGSLYQRTGQSEESEKMMQEALKKGSDEVVTRMAVAEWALTAGKIDMAKENAEAVLKMNPDAVRAKILTGQVKRHQGDHVGAEEVFRKVYDKSPASFVASDALVRSLLAQADKEKQQQALQYAQVNASRYKDIRTAVGREAAASFAFGLHKLGQDVAAERVMQKVITNGEVSPQIGYFAAMIYKSRGRLDVAQQLLKKSLDSYIAFPEQTSAQKLLEMLADEEDAGGTEVQEAAVVKPVADTESTPTTEASSVK